MKRRALGKGLEALLPTAAPTATNLIELDVHQIRSNPYQPRHQFDSEKLEDLAASILENGVIQPVVVRPAQEGYELVAGERRWRAAQKAGLARIPAIVQDVSNRRLVELALVENIQRDDLSPIEEAQAYQLLTEEFGLTQEEIARRVGRSRSAVTNLLRLLRLPRAIQQAVLSRQISMGHARALLPLSAAQQTRLAQEVARRGLSVREVERRVQHLMNPAPPRPARRDDPHLTAAENHLEERWNTRVEIRRRGATGQIRLHFHTDQELERLYQGLLGELD